MPATFSRLKDWIAETLLYEDLNAEFDNIFNNFDPLGVGSYSANVAQMQETEDPYPGGNPSLANALAGELERLRYQIQAIMGEDAAYWYVDPPVTLSQLQDTVLEGGLPSSRLDSGPTNGSNMLEFVRPDTGSNGTAIVVASVPNPIVYYVAGTRYTRTSNVSVSGFTAAPTTNNTALVNNSAYSGQQYTSWLGEHGTFIPVDTVGSEITLVQGKLAGYKVNNGSTNEYFIGEYMTQTTPITFTGTTTNLSTSVTGVTNIGSLAQGMPVSGTGIQVGTTIASITLPSTITLSLAANASVTPTLTASLITTGIYRARRGMFFNQAFTPYNRITFSDNAVITLCRVAWLFIGTNGAISATYNTPTYSAVAPTSPDLGDFWFDLGTTTWKSYSPSGWAESGAVFIGEIILEGANVVGGRTADRYKNYSNINDVQVEVNPLLVTELRHKNYGGRTSVYGFPFRLGFRDETWTSANLDPAGSLQNNTTYYIYVTEGGANKLSTLAPHDRKGDLGGYYHPTEPWRCFGYITTNGSAQFVSTALVNFSNTRETNFYFNGFPEEALASGSIVQANGTGQFSVIPQTILSATSAVYTAAAGGWQPVVGCYLVLPVGLWRCFGSAQFLNSGSSPTYQAFGMGLYASSSGSPPALLSTLSNVTIETPYPAQNGLALYLEGQTASSASLSQTPIDLRVTSGTATIYLVPYSIETTHANVRLTGYFSARRIG